MAVYEAAVAGWEAKLAKLPVRVVAPKAEKIAEVGAVLGADRAKAKVAVQLIKPFALALLLELTAIVAFGYGLARIVHRYGWRRRRALPYSRTVRRTRRGNSLAEAWVRPKTTVSD